MFDTGEPLGSQVVRLHALAADVAVGIDGELAGSAAVQLLAEVEAAGRQLELARVTLVERIDRSGAFADDGSKSTFAFLRRAANEADGWASRQVRVGRALADRLPATRKAWEAGLLGMAQAELIAAAVKDLDDELAADIEAALALAAPDISLADLKGLRDMLRQQAAPEQAAGKDSSDYHKQALTLNQTMDGTWDLRGRFDPEAGAIIRQVLDGFLSRASTVRGPDGQLVPPPPLPWRRAQALLNVCRTAAGHHESCDPTVGYGRPTVITTVALKDLRDGYGAGQLEGGQILSVPALRRLACDADVIRQVVGAHGETLDFGRRSRLVPASLRRYLVSRDGGCLFPSCDAPPARCEAHHQKHWVHGGETNPHNTLLLCLYHHHLVHERGWTLTGNPDTDGDLTFHPPKGKGPPQQTERKTVHRAMRTLLDALKPRSPDQEPSSGRGFGPLTGCTTPDELAENHR